MPELDAAALENFLLLGLALLWAGVVKYLQHHVLPLGGEQPSGKRQGGWIYLHSSGAMKIMAAVCAGFALIAAWFAYLAAQYLKNPGAWTGPGAAPEPEGVIIGMFLALIVLIGGVYGALAFVRTPMRYSDTEILFRSAFGRERAIPWRDVLHMDLRKPGDPVLAYKGRRRKELCAACAGFREFVTYAAMRGVTLVERRRS